MALVPGRGALKWLCISALGVVVTVLCVSAFVQGIHRIPGNSETTLYDEYNSTSTGIGFKYPHGWSVSDSEFKDYGAGQFYTNNNLSVCPVGDALLAAPKSEPTDSCITLFTQHRLETPSSDMFDAKLLFESFNEYMQAQNVPGEFRIMSQSFTTTTDEVNLLGLYREDARYVGLYQALCERNKKEACALVFKQVLDSVHFSSGF